MPLPEVVCPNCRVRMSLDVVLADDGVRDMLLALVDVHPAGDSFIKPLLRYIGLFGPKKTQMANGRMASLIRELEPEMRAAQVKRDGAVYAAPMALWASAFSYAVDQANHGRLELPLKSHGWLRSVIAGQAARAASQAEADQEAQRRGIAGAGTPEARRQAATTTVGPAAVSEQLPKTEMPQEVREALNNLKKGRQ
ncbi:MULTISPECIES: hypothetical protein [Ralstonia solanacearum species complex]|uniref:Uncharacterized protein n=2 Tax=Ralstonia solanacearum TaxID=305 RepID=A0ABF7REG1_RALSL|nr:hypothetical protein [Ralstonia solanacearum]ALF87429.1 hypothetical protein RSUY_10560 [Ralstonia solanacearum]ATI26955.1 hypothetical protein CCY86_05280 [Ralstonia solanacearum]ATJ85722.1 hypothetical protein CDC59_05240 [Ralstonia solanacearum]EAP72776.1 Conserved hypothetical protein [Ralstonia solanacearum UW551]KEI32999.1 hypothetical protein CQ06_12830 [Ralstonia solanacearum]